MNESNKCSQRDRDCERERNGGRAVQMSVERERDIERKGESEKREREN